MKLKDEGCWTEYRDVNVDGYGKATLDFAERWADSMEARVERGERVGDVAEECFREANVDGVTGFMYGVAVAILSRAWKFGEDLRVWHNLNTQVADEGERANRDGGVLNPAILQVGARGDVEVGT